MVYVIQCRENGLIKIGCTEKFVGFRMEELLSKRTEPATLVLLALVTGSHEREHRLHRQFSKVQNPGFFAPFGVSECFSPAPVLLARIARFPRHKLVGLTVAAGVPKPRMPRCQRRCGDCRQPGHEHTRCPLKGKAA